MPFTRGARVPTQTPASNSDARKRKAEKDQRVIEVKVDVGTDEIDIDGNLIPLADLPNYARRLTAALAESQREAKELSAALTEMRPDLTPPPAPRDPWSVISTDRDKPTLAKVTWEHGTPNGLVGRWWLVGGRRLCRDGDRHSRRTDHVAHVEVLHTYDPETHVPVERAALSTYIDASTCSTAGEGATEAVIERVADVLNEVSQRTDDEYETGGFEVEARALAAAGLLAGVPARSEAEIKAEALREFADELAATEEIGFDDFWDGYAYALSEAEKGARKRADALAPRAAGTTEAGDGS